MKKFALISVLCASGLFGSMSALADTQTVAATMTISAICKFSGTTAPIAFGTVDPSSGGIKTFSLSFGYKCTKGTTPTAISAGANSPMVGALTTPDSIPFTVGGFTAGVVGTGFSTTALTSGATISVAQAAYQDVKADLYTGSLVVNILP